MTSAGVSGACVLLIVQNPLAQAVAGEFAMTVLAKKTVGTYALTQLAYGEERGQKPVSIEVEGMIGGHTITIDAHGQWPIVTLTCTCGWESAVDADGEDGGLRDAISRVWTHTGGPKRMLQHDGKEVRWKGDIRLDHNTLNQRLDDILGT